VSDHERWLRSLAVNDEATAASILDVQADPDELSTMDSKTRALVRLGAVVALGASPVTYQWAAQVALAAGATDDEIVGTLIAVGPVSGVTRVVSAAPAVAIALDYNIDEAFEAPAKPGCRGD
jgi:4-carboxymuconolactone decarboxylase